MTMAMKNPPRRTTIRGQKHLLAYITPEEADVLKAMGGSGKPGPMGIPAFYDNDRPGMGGEGEMGDRGGFGGDDNAGGEGSSGRGGDPRGESSMSGGAGAFGEAGRGGRTGVGGGRESREAMERAVAGQMAAQAAREAAAESARLGMSPGAMGGRIGSAYQTAPSVGRGFDVQLQKARSAIASSPYTGWVDRMIENAYQTGKAPGLMGSLLDVPIGRFQNFKTAPPGYKGVFRSFDMLTPLAPGPISTFVDMLGLPTEYYMTTGWGNDLRDPDMGGEWRNEIVDAEYNPNTGQQDQCPDGYMFDEDLQACRLAGGLPGGDSTTGDGELGPATGDLYGRMGLLDIAPTGLGMFKERFGAGFGTPSEFDAANLAFRRSGGVQRPYEGYTLLS